MKNNKNQSITKAYGLYCNDNFIYAYETREEAEEALASRLRLKHEAATRIAQKAYDDCSNPVTEFEFDKILASNEYEVEEIEIDDSDSPAEVAYRITRDDEAFMDFQSKDEAVEVFLKLVEDSINEMNEKLKELSQADFDKALSFKINYNEADALLWELEQIPRYKIIPVSREDENAPLFSVQS